HAKQRELCTRYGSGLGAPALHERRNAHGAALQQSAAGIGRRAGSVSRAGSDLPHHLLLFSVVERCSGLSERRHGNEPARLVRSARQADWLTGRVGTLWRTGSLTGWHTRGLQPPRSSAVARVRNLANGTASRSEHSTHLSPNERPLAGLVAGWQPD